MKVISNNAESKKKTVLNEFYYSVGTVFIL